jgi:hypothetical protein
MRDHGGAAAALTALTALVGGLRTLEAGDLSIAAFGDAVRVLHPFGGAVPSEAQLEACAAQFTFNDEKTRCGALLETALANLHEARLQAAGRAAPLQLVILVSDGRFDASARAQLRRAQRDAVDAGVAIVLVLLDRPGRDSILEMKSVAFDEGGGVAISPYLDGYPFPCYVVLRDVRELPETLASALKQGAEASSLSSPSKVRRASLGQSPPKQAAQEEQTPPPAPQTPQTAQVTDEDLALAERIAAAAASANKKGGRRKSAMVGQIAMAAQMGLVHQAEAKAPASATPQAAAAPHANLLALTSRADAHLSSRPHAQSVAPRPPPVAERAARLPQAAPPKTKRKSITTMFQGKGRGGRVVGSTVISTSNHEFCVWPSAPPDGKYAQHKEGDTGSTDAKPFTLPAGFRPASVADADFAGMNAEVIAAHGWSTLHLAVAKSGSFGQDGRGWALYYSKNTEGEGKERAPGMEVEYDEQDVSYARALGGDRFVVTDGDIRMLLRRDGV